MGPHFRVYAPIMNLAGERSACPKENAPHPSGESAVEFAGVCNGMIKRCPEQALSFYRRMVAVRCGEVLSVRLSTTPQRSTAGSLTTWSAERLTFCDSITQTGLGALTDQAQLELRNVRKYTEDQLPGRGR